MDEYDRTLKLENERFREIMDLLKTIAIGIVCFLIAVGIAVVILLGQHTGQQVCDECANKCVRQGPTHLELLLDR